MKLVPVLFVAAYPFLVHGAVVFRAPLLEWFALLLLVGVPLWPRLAALRSAAWGILATLGGLLYALTRFGGGVYALYLPSVVIPGVLLWTFGATLRPGRVPLITRIADEARGPLQADLLQYTRLLTQAWSAIFALMTLSALGLALFAPLQVWSLFTNFINYAVSGAIFLLEYLYRRRRFPQHDHPDFVEYLRILARAGIRRA